MDICLRVLKESNQSRFDSYSVRSSVLNISHITFRDYRLHIFSDNLSRNAVCYLNYPYTVCFWLLLRTHTRSESYVLISYRRGQGT